MYAHYPASTPPIPEEEGCRLNALKREEDKDNLLKRANIFYGYWILAACSLFTLVSAGSGTGAFSLFIKLLEKDLGWSRTEIMAAFTLFIFVMGLASPFAGRLLDRYGARKVIPTGSFIMVIGFVLLSQMSRLWHFYLGYVLVGVGSTANGPLASSYVVSHWFRKRRGMAVGILSMGMGLSGIVFAFLVAVTLIPNLGWRNAYFALASITGGVIIPLSIFVIRTKPADSGVFPDGIGAAGTDDTIEDNPSPSEGLPLKLALATPAFWLIGVSLVLNHTHLGVLQSVFPHLTDIGFPEGIGASAISITSVMGTLSFFFFGWLCDKISPKYAAAIGLGLIALAILILTSIGPGSPVELIWLYAMIMGIGMGSWLPTMSMLTSDTFGMASYGTLFGVLSLFQNFGGGTSPLLAGYLYDSMHTYHWAFILILAMVVLAIPLVLAVKRPVLRTQWNNVMEAQRGTQ
jgi:MFS family permease